MSFYDRFRASVFERKSSSNINNRADGLLHIMGMTAKCATDGSNMPVSPLLAGMKGGSSSRSEKGDGALEPGQMMPKAAANRRPRRKKPAPKKRRQPPKPPLMPLEMVGKVSRNVTQELMQIEDGLGITMMQSISDNSKMGKEPDSYFMVRHMLNFDGPQGYSMNGGTRGYQCSFESNDKGNHSMSAQWQGPMLIGTVDKTWNKLFSSSAQFEMTNSKIPQLAAMFPAYSINIDCKNTERCLRFHLAKNPYMPGMTTSISLMNQVWRGFSLGAKVTANLKMRSTDFSIGAKYRKPIKNGFETYEGLWNATAGSWKAWYTRSLGTNTILTAGIEMTPSSRRALGSYGYRYSFGAGKTITGSANSNMEFKQAMTIPLVDTILLRVHGQMNHKTANPQRGIFPNIFGVSLILQM